MNTQKLLAELETLMQETYDSLTAETNNTVISGSDVDKFFDEDLHGFMKDKFGYEYDRDDNAQEFYQMQACDMRGDFERKLVEWMEENAERKPRIEL